MTFRTRPAHIFGRLTDARTITVYRTAPGSRDSSGEWVPGASSTVDVLASTVPVERERAIGEDGARLLAERTFWSTSPLYARREDRDGDLIQYAAQWWRIVAVERFPSHYEAMAVRIEGQTPGSATPPALINTGSAAAERMFRRYVALGAGLYTLDSTGTMIETQNVIPAFGPGPAPVEAYATLFLSEAQQEGTGSETRAKAEMTDDTEITTTSVLRGTVTVDFYRAGAALTARQLIPWLQGPVARAAEARLGIAVQRNPAPRMTRTDGLVADRFEERATLEFEAEWTDAIVENVGRIDEVSIELCEDDSGHNETITVD